jgi:pyridoxamine 5'-phosphate oxidase family protein
MLAMFTEAEVAYLDSQSLARLATVTSSGQPQVRPTSYHYNPDTRTIDIGGYRMRETQKYRNVVAGSLASLVVDEVISTDPWTVRGIEVRGTAEVLADQEPYFEGFSGDIVRIHPTRILSWGLDTDDMTMNARDVS